MAYSQFALDELRGGGDAGVKALQEGNPASTELGIMSLNGVTSQRYGVVVN
jgi:hypothetical protein